MILSDRATLGKTKGCVPFFEKRTLWILECGWVESEKRLRTQNCSLVLHSAKSFI